MLAVRPLKGYTTLGRETFLARVIWEKDWPVVNPGIGMLTDTVEINLPEWKPETVINQKEKYYDFTKQRSLGAEFLTIRNPQEGSYTLTEKGLQISFGKYTLKEKESPSYLALRQENHFFEAAAVLSTANLSERKKAGIALVQSNEYHLRAEVSRGVAGKIKIKGFLCKGGQDELVCSREILLTGETLSLHLRVKGLTAEMFWESEETGEDSLLFDKLDISSLSTEAAGGFVGCTVGMYAVEEEETVSGAAGSGEYALFISFRYQELSEVFWEREGEYR